MLRRVIDLFRKRMFVRQVGILAGGTAAAHAINIAAMPVLTRLYSPEELGILFVFLSFVSWCSGVVALRYEHALIVTRTAFETASLFLASVGTIFLTTILCYGVLRIAITHDIAGFGAIPSGLAIFLFPILLGVSLFELLRMLQIRAGGFYSVTTAVITRSGAQAAVRIALGLAGAGAPGLLGAEGVANWAGALSMLRGAFGYIRGSWRRIRLRFCWALMARYRRFPALEAPSVTINAVAATLPIPLIAALYGPEQAGLFGLAYRIAAVPNSQVGAAVADVLQKHIGDSIRSGERQKAARLFGKVTRRLAMVGLIPMAGFMIAGPLLFGFVFGESWAQSGLVVAAIAPWLYAAFVAGSLSRLLSVVQRQDLKLIYDVSRLASVLAVFWFARELDLSFLSAIVVLSVVSVMNYGVYFLLLLYACRHELQLYRAADLRYRGGGDGLG